MQSDLDKAIKLQPLTDDQVQLLVYQILRGLKVGGNYSNGSYGNNVVPLLYLVYSFCWSTA